jgi:hypothetical protein
MTWSAWGWTLAWVAARATALAVVGIGAYAWARRRGPNAGSAAALASLVALVAVAGLGVAPWPWAWPTPRPQAPAASPAQIAEIEPGPEPRPLGRPARTFGGSGPITPRPTVGGALPAFARLFGTRDAEVAQAAATADSSPAPASGPMPAPLLGAEAIVFGGPEVVFAAARTPAPVPPAVEPAPPPPPAPRPRLAQWLSGLAGAGGDGAAPRGRMASVAFAAGWPAARPSEPESAPEPDAVPTQAPADSVADADPHGWADRIVAGLAGAFAVGLALELLRLAAGLWAVDRLRRGSRPVADAASLDTLAELSGALGLRRPVALRTAPQVSCPATVGWLRPAVFLPEGWADWPDDERRAVLAHELAHVKRRDYPGWLAAQISVATHFYHPMAHWLAGRLRLQQELAADADAAPLAGGRRAYLAALATLALRQDRGEFAGSSGLAWPARPFFPRLGTLVRRIEMLRNATDEPRRGLSPAATRVITYGLLLAAGFGLAGLRASHGPGEAKADATTVQDAAKQAPAQAELPSVLDYVPDDAALIVSARPSAFLKRTEVRALLEAVAEEPEVARALGLLDPESIEQVTAVLSRSATGLLMSGGDEEALLLAGGLIVRTKSARDWKSVIGAVVPAPIVESRHAGQVYHSLVVEDTISVGFFQPDERTLVAAPLPALFGFMQARPRGVEHRWADAWRQVAADEIAVVADVGSLAGPFLPMLAAEQGDNAEAALLLGTVAPLWEETESLALGVSFDEGFGVQLIARCGDETGAKRVERTLQAILTLGENAGQRFFPLIRREALGGDGEAAALLTLVDLGEQLLEGAEARRDGQVVRMALDSRVDLGAIVRLGLIAL